MSQDTLYSQFEPAFLLHPATCNGRYGAACFSCKSLFADYAYAYLNSCGHIFCGHCRKSIENGRIKRCPSKRCSRPLQLSQMLKILPKGRLEAEKEDEILEKIRLLESERDLYKAETEKFSESILELKETVESKNREIDNLKVMNRELQQQLNELPPPPPLSPETPRLPNVKQEHVATHRLENTIKELREQLVMAEKKVLNLNMETQLNNDRILFLTAQNEERLQEIEKLRKEADLNASQPVASSSSSQCNDDEIQFCGEQRAINSPETVVVTQSGKTVKIALPQNECNCGTKISELSERMKRMEEKEARMMSWMMYGSEVLSRRPPASEASPSPPATQPLETKDTLTPANKKKRLSKK